MTIEFEEIARFLNENQLWYLIPFIIGISILLIVLIVNVIILRRRRKYERSKHVRSKRTSK